MKKFMFVLVIISLLASACSARQEKESIFATGEAQLTEMAQEIEEFPATTTPFPPGENEHTEELTTPPVMDYTPGPDDAGGGRDIVLPDNCPGQLAQFCEMIEKAAADQQAFGVTSSLISAIVIKYGGWSKLDPAYVNPEYGFVGLMAIMPADAKGSKLAGLDLSEFTKRPSTEELKNPQFNIEWGTALLASLIDAKGGILEGLTAYTGSAKAAQEILELAQTLK